LCFVSEVRRHLKSLQRSVFVILPPTLTDSNYAFCPHNVFVCFK
jgi:hypothetical protein